VCAHSRLGAGGSAGARCCRSGSCIILALEALRWLPDSSCLTRPHSYHMRVDCAGNAVLHLSVQLWEHISIIDACLLDISNSCLLHYVADKESLYSLILGDTTAAVGAAYRVHVATPMLVPSSTASLHRHGCRCNPKREKECNKESTATANDSDAPTTAHKRKRYRLGRRALNPKSL
jgi:hypothetical protein